MRTLWGLALVAVAGVASAQAGERAAEEKLPAAARAVLVERMGNHRADMARLHTAVLLLEHETTARLARSVAAEPRLAQPLGDEGAELNSLVPARFFELQDELRERALELAAAAGRADDAAIARAWGQLNETCVRCHAAYLDDRQ